jgi:hypothetical protein
MSLVTSITSNNILPLQLHYHQQSALTFILSSVPSHAAGAKASSTAAAAAAGSIGAVALLLAAAAASAIYKRQQAAAASKVMPQPWSDATSSAKQLAGSSSAQLDGADGAGLCVPTADSQVRLLHRNLRLLCCKCCLS